MIRADSTTQELREELQNLESKVVQMRNFYTTLAHVNLALTRVQDKQSLFEEVCQIAVRHGGFRAAWIGLAQETSDLVRPVAKFGACPDYIGMSQVSVDGTKAASRGPTGTAIRENRTDYIMDLETDQRSLPWRQEMIRCGFQSSISTPIHEHEQVVGVLTLYSASKNMLGAEAISLVEEITQAIAMAIQYLEQNADKARAEEQVHRLAYYDSLTQLPNRIFLADYINQAIADTNFNHRDYQNGVDSNFAIGFLDLDGFKEVNDSQGHAIGDRVLKEVAARIQTILRLPNLVARFGGDEFVLVLHVPHRARNLIPLLTEIRNAVSAPIRLENIVVQISCSIGIATFKNGDDSAETLLRDADIAMYEAKDNGRNQVSFFSQEIIEKREAKKRLREEVEEGIRKGQFCLYYQPQVNMKTGTVVGAEALIRWHHPRRGLVAPGEFLYAVLNDPIMNQIGNWVLEEAVAQLALWLEKGLMVKVSVNISAHQFQDPDFVRSLRSILRRHPGVSPSHLKLELLEDAAFTESFDRVQKNIELCGDLGIVVALDDFGTGYSSLTHIQRLAVKEVKVDQTFTRGLLSVPKNIAIVSGLMSTALPSRLQVIAEGVEDEGTGILLLGLGCELAQGYFISKPMPAAEFVEWCANWAPIPSWVQREPWRLLVSDLPVATAGLVHQHMSDIIVDSLSQASLFERHVFTAHQCEFGQWYDTLGTERYGHMESFRMIEKSHQRVHILSAEIIQCRNLDDSACAKFNARQLSDHLPSFTSRVDAFLEEIDRD